MVNRTDNPKVLQCLPLINTFFFTYETNLSSHQSILPIILSHKTCHTALSLCSVRSCSFTLRIIVSICFGIFSFTHAPMVPAPPPGASSYLHHAVITAFYNTICKFYAKFGFLPVSTKLFTATPARVLHSKQKVCV